MVFFFFCQGKFFFFFLYVFFFFFVFCLCVFFFFFFFAWNLLEYSRKFPKGVLRVGS